MKKGFMLIEVLVIVVIIGILATIGFVTFRGYFIKSRDKERLAVVRNMATLIKTNQSKNDVPDYKLEGTDAATIETNFKDILTKRGYSIPVSKKNVNYYYLVPSSAPFSDFIVFVCKEYTMNVNPNTTDPAETLAFIDGTDNGILAVTDTIAQLACTGQISPIAPVLTGYDVINLDE